MRIIIVLLTLLLLQLQAWAQDYTLRLQLTEDSVEIRQGGGYDTLPAAISQDVTIELQTTGLKGRPWSISVLAMGNLFGTEESIPASYVSWEALTEPFIDGTLVAGVPQVLAQGAGNTHVVGRVRFRFQPGEFASGRYDQVIRFILSSP